MIQQIQHGVILLLAEYKVFGHAIPGIIEPTLEEYTHLGDASSKTDGRIYAAKLGALETNEVYSGVPDDRWAFTTPITPLNYDVASGLAAASRVLRGFDDKMAGECLETSVRIWDEDHKHAPVLFHSFNTTGGDLADDRHGDLGRERGRNRVCKRDVFSARAISGNCRDGGDATWD